MDGLTLGGILAVIALVIFGWAGWVRMRERRLLRRLVAAEARVLNQGISPQTSIFVSTDANGARTERTDIEYHGRWEYQVAGQIHVGTVTAPAPVFTTAQMPPARITVYYDPANPATSRLSASMPDTMAMALAIFGGVVLAVAALLALIPNIDRIIAALGY